ncbi:CD63 antigen, partial [Clarias magur]
MAPVTGGMKCVKFLIFSINFVFLLCSLAFFMLGFLVKNDLISVPNVSQQSKDTSSIFFMVVGGVVIFVTFFGSCGAWKENHCMVITFVILLSFILIAEIFLTVGGYVLLNKMLANSSKTLQTMIKEYKTKDKYKKIMDNIQQQLECCGSVAVSDWVGFQPDGISVPDSCCRNVTLNCGAKAMNNSKVIYTEGCWIVHTSFYYKIVPGLGVTILVIALIEIFSVVLGCMLICGMRKGYKVIGNDYKNVTVCGLALIIVGVLAKVAVNDFPEVQQLANTSFPIVIIVVGVVIFFIAFFGCCGAWKDNYCMVTTFAVLLSFIIIIEIGIAITAYVFRGQLKTIVEGGMNKMIKNYTNPDIQKNVDKLQHKLKCCGSVNASDWINYKPDKNSVPDSCCKNQTQSCGAGALKDSSKIFNQGCATVVEDFLKKNILWVGVAALVIAFIE